MTNEEWHNVLERELTPVVTVPAPGGELTILKSRRLPEAEQLARVESILHGMIEGTENALENPRPGISNKLLPRPSQLAKGISDVAKRLECKTRHKDSLELLHKLAAGQERAEGKINEMQVAAEDAQAGVSFLVHDRKERLAVNKGRGKASRAKAVLDNAEIDRAKRDLETALKRVAANPDVKAEKHGAIIAACRRVCRQFATLTDAKKNGKPTYLPLTSADGKPVKPETLARYYREKHNSKRGKK